MLSYSKEHRAFSKTKFMLLGHDHISCNIVSVGETHGIGAGSQ